MATLALVDELIALEEKNLAGGLDEAEHRRWVDISSRVFGTPGDIAERRRYFRVSLVRPAEVRLPDKDPDAKILSLSGGGMFVSTSCVAEVGSVMQVAVTLPVKWELVVPFEGTVRWVADAPPGREGVTRTGVGLNFGSLDDTQRDALAATIREELLRSRTRLLDRYHAYFAGLPEAVLVIDGLDSIVACSDRAQVLAPTRGQSLVGMDLGEVVTNETRPTLAQAVAAARSESRTSRCAISLGADDGTAPVPVDALISPLPADALEGGVVVSCRPS